MTTKLGITVGADIKSFAAGMAAAKRELAGLATAAKTQAAAASRSFARIRSALGGVPAGVRAGIQDIVAAQRQLKAAADKVSVSVRNSREVASSFTGIGAAIRSVLPAAAALTTILASIRTSDSLANLQAQLRRAAGDTESAGVAFRALFDEAQRRGTSLSGLTKIYSDLAAAARGTGTSQEALLQLTTAVNDAFTLSGKSAAEAGVAIDILSLSMVTGAVSTEQLNTLYRQTPHLVDALAKGTGKSIIELKKLAAQGKLTPQQLVEGLIAAKDDLAKAADDLPLTFERAFEKIKNSLLKMIGPFQSGLNVIAEKIGDLADFLSSDSTIGAIEGFVIDVSTAFQQLRTVVTEIINELTSAFPEWVAQSAQDFDKFATAGSRAAKFVLDAFKNMPANIRAFVKIITIEFVTLFDALLALGTYFKDAFAAIFSNDTASAAADRYRARLQAITDAKRDDIAATLDQLQATKAKSAADARAAKESAQAERDINALLDDLTRRKPRVGRFGSGGSKAAETRAAEALEKARLEGEDKLAEDARKRALEQLAVFHDRKLITEEQFIDARTALELKGVDAEIAIERRRLGPGGVEAIKARDAIQILENKKTDVVTKGEEDRHKVRTGFAEQTRNLEIDLLSAQGQDLDADIARLALKYQALINDLVARGNLGGAKIAQALFNQEFAGLQFAAIQRDFDKFAEQLRNREQSLANQQATGALSAVAAERQLRDERARTLAQLSELVFKLQEVAAASQNPEQLRVAEEATLRFEQTQVDAMTGVDGAVRDLRGSLQNLQEQFASSAKDAAVDAFSNFLVSLGDRTKSAGEKLKDFVRSFAQSMAQLAARALATLAVLYLLEAAFPGAGRIVAASGAIQTSGGEIFHRGGIAGKGRQHRNVAPWVFAGAPRLHDGGLPGIRANEVPAILQAGEEVLTRNDPRHVANGGGAGTSVRIINAIEPEHIQKAMSNPGGDKVIVNAIRSNAGAVKQLLREF